MDNIIMDPKEYIDSRLDDAYRALDAKIEGMKSEHRGLESKMDGLNHKIDAVLIELKAYKPLIEQVITLYNATLAELKELRKERKIGFTPEKEEAE